MVTTPAMDCKSSTFAYWSVNGKVLRDELGRALDAVTFVMSEEATEAVAVSISNESDRKKLYWYGDNAMSDLSDTDNDGFNFLQEMAAGTNPLIKDSSILSGLAYANTSVLQYNPYSMHSYAIRSEPEGLLFETKKDFVRPGTIVKTTKCDCRSSYFAYWILNGVSQRDGLGRALDSVELKMPSNDVDLVAVCIENENLRQKMYWYGDATIADVSDTDNDGYDFLEELRAGTNPHIGDETILSGLVFGDSIAEEVNLQLYEQLTGAIVNGKYAEVFTSPTAGNAATSETFGLNLQPVVADVNGDGLWDLVLVSDIGVKVLVNVGAKGNPEFEERAVDLSAVDLAMNSTEKLDTLDLDTPVIGALSATVWGAALLASDSEGRIWYYRGSQTLNPLTSQPLNFILQHKVWGGSHPGFAKGLRLAAVDWDDDGDLDCLCGTAEGKLMLLRDPKVGRPTNLKAFVGIDNVKLDWDPNQQSRIRGYRVYRADEVKGEGEQWNLLASPSLPTYRDYPPSMSDFDYKVSSVSRHYVAGNSEPIVNESPATEAVRASLGKVSLHWTDVVAKRGEMFSLMLSIDNSANLSPEGMTIEIEYDHDVLNLLKLLPSGLFEQGKIAPGSGKLYEYVFEVFGEGAGETTVSVKSATMFGLGGGRVTVVLPEKNATITIAARPESAPYQLGDVNGDGKVDELDVRLLAQLKNAAGRKWTANQLKAGDFNGNGKLDNADYQALRAMLKEKGLL